MKKIVVASAREGAGKTTAVIGIGRKVSGKIGYMKPFGDRIYYHKKRLWDYDSVAVAKTLGISEAPEKLSIGFEHSKLMYMFDREGIAKKVRELFEEISTGKDMVFIEGSKDMNYGASVNLDSFSVARYLQSSMLMIFSGKEEDIFDDIVRCKELAEMKGVKIVGAIINKVRDVNEWKEIHVQRVEKEGIHVLGILPEIKELSTITAEFVADQLPAKVLAGEKGLHNEIESIFIGAMSVSAAIKNPLFNKKKKLILTSGDRTDMVLTALREDTSCIVLTNNIIPPARIREMADEKGIPLLLTPWDTYTSAKKLENIKPWISEKNEKKMRAVETAFESLDTSWIMNM